MLDSDPASDAAIAAVKGPIRDAAHAAAPDGTEALVGGTTSVFVDFQKAMNRDYRVVFPVAALVIMLILALLLRSLVAPLYLMASVGLGFGATLGATVLVFQNVQGDEGLIFMLPIYIYLFVVALGTDYNILMIARLREEAREGREPRDGGRRRSSTPGPTVAAAGLILAGTFASLMLAGNALLVCDGLRDLLRHLRRGVRDGDVLHARADRADRARGLVARPRRRDAGGAEGAAGGLTGREDGVGLDLDDPAWIEQPGHDDHRARRAHGTEHLAVHGPDRVRHIVANDVLPRADDVVHARAELLECGGDDLPAPPRLDGGVRVHVTIGPDRSRAADGDRAPDPDCAAESHRLLVRRSRARVATFHTATLGQVVRSSGRRYRGPVHGIRAGEHAPTEGRRPRSAVGLRRHVEEFRAPGQVRAHRAARLHEEPPARGVHEQPIGVDRRDARVGARRQVPNRLPGWDDASILRRDRDQARDLVATVRCVHDVTAHLELVVAGERLVVVRPLLGTLEDDDGAAGSFAGLVEQHPAVGQNPDQVALLEASGLAPRSRSRSRCATAAGGRRGLSTPTTRWSSRALPGVRGSWAGPGPG